MGTLEVKPQSGQGYRKNTIWFAERADPQPRNPDPELLRRAKEGYDRYQREKRNAERELQSGRSNDR